MARLTTLLFAMWLGVTVSTVVDLEKRVYGGRACERDERRYHVKLRSTDTNGNQYLCGGSLISDQWILTAAHCFKLGGTITAHIQVLPGRLQEKGITDQPKIFNDGQQHDLMLLKLPKAVGIIPIRLPDCQHRPNISDVVQIAGHTSATVDLKKIKQPGYSATLQCAEMNIADCQDLKQHLFKVNPISYVASDAHEHWICYKTPGVDACRGDSGGGVVYNHRIYGVHVTSGEKACVVSAASMDLCHQPYLKWIKDTIKQPGANAASG